MELGHRRVTYKLYPSATQRAALERLCDLHRGLYNAALQERIDAWRLARKSVGYAEQCRSLTQVRRENPEYLGVNAQSLQVTLKRLDLAFAAFFRRVKASETPGFPRYKGRDRFPGFGFKTHGDGFRFEPGPNWRHGRLRLSGVGMIRARGEARTPGQIVRCGSRSGRRGPSPRPAPARWRRQGRSGIAIRHPEPAATAVREQASRRDGVRPSAATVSCSV